MQRIAIKAGDLTFLGVALTLMIALAGTSYLLAPPQTADLRGSTYSARREGAKAAFLLLKQLGYKIERSYVPIAALRAAPRETVLVLASPGLRAAPQDLRALQTFIEHGGVVIATGGGGNFLPNLGMIPVVEVPLLLRRQGLPTIDRRKPPAEESRATPYHATIPSLLTRGVPKLLLESEIAGPAPTPVDYAVMYRDASGPGVLAGSFGDGHAIWLIGATPFLNGEIEKPGSLEFVLNAIGTRDRAILWDEYYHGYDRGLISYLATTQLSTAFAQLALIAFLALFTFSRRHGPVRPLLVRPRTNAMEFVDAVSALYQKARAGSGAVETARARLRRMLVAAAQVPAISSDAQLAAAAAVRHPIDQRALRELLAETAEASHDPDLPPDRALTLVQRLQAMMQRVRQAGE